MEIKISITEARHNTNNIINEKIVCLIISIFIFSLFLSFTIDLYNLKALTAIAIIAGMNNKFCRTSETTVNIIPLESPITIIIVEIVYPKQNPLYNTIPKTMGIPYYCCSKKPQGNC